MAWRHAVRRSVVNPTPVVGIPAHDVGLLMAEVVRVNSALGRYVVGFVDADTGRGREMAVDDERTLAAQVASVAEGIRARADGRECGAGPAVPSSENQESRVAGCPEPSAVWPDETLRVLDDDTVARWPLLAPLAAVPGPRWQVRAMPNGTISCARACGSYAEAVWVVSDDLVGFNRTPVRVRPGRTASRLDVTGSLDEVVDELRRPVRWEDQP